MLPGGENDSQERPQEPPGAPQEHRKSRPRGQKKEPKRVTICGSALGGAPGGLRGPFWSHFGSMLAPFWSVFWSDLEVNVRLRWGLFSLLFFLVCFGFFGLLVSLRPVIFPRLLRDRAGKPRENRRKTRGNAPSSKRRGGGAQRRREASVACPGSLSRCSCCPARGGFCSSWCFFAVSACSVRCDLRALVSLALLAALASNALPVP